jgi:hypothetical protein
MLAKVSFGLFLLIRYSKIDSHSDCHSGVPPIKQSKHLLTPKFFNLKNRLPLLD